eukprot:835891-Amphidinium_carterae.1
MGYFLDWGGALPGFTKSKAFLVLRLLHRLGSKRLVMHEQEHQMSAHHFFEQVASDKLQQRTLRKPGIR